jgi:hypothetical protein
MRRDVFGSGSVGPDGDGGASVFYGGLPTPSLIKLPLCVCVRVDLRNSLATHDFVHSVGACDVGDAARLYNMVKTYLSGTDSSCITPTLGKYVCRIGSYV